jgi:hypothetical protein
LSGAELGARAIRVPYVGPVVGAVLGAAVGSEVGKRLGRAFVAGGDAFIKMLTSWATVDGQRNEAECRTEALAGGPDDFMTVCRLVLRGSSVDIGRALAREARDVFGWQPAPAFDPVRNRARRRWFERNWPQHYERMAGMAVACGLDVDDDTIDFSNAMAVPTSARCSAVWCSSNATPNGHALVSRNLDFTTLTLSEMLGAPPIAGEPPALGSNHHPSRCGSPSISVGSIGPSAAKARTMGWGTRGAPIPRSAS